MCLVGWRCSYILDSDTRLGDEWLSLTPRPCTAGACCAPNWSEGSIERRDSMNVVEKRKPLLLPGIEPGFSWHLGRGLANNWAYLTEEPDFIDENRVSNATWFMLMLLSGAGDRFVLSQLQLLWLWNHSRRQQHDALLTRRGSDWAYLHRVISQWLQDSGADPRYLQLWPRFASINLSRRRG
jgi:hypothetical protein